jgi:two-component system response regulator RegX3
MPDSERVDILVVEDEESLRTGTCDVLAFHGYQPLGVETGEEGLKEALSGRFGLILLDLMLPGIDGFEVCERVRAKIPRQPILMLTAKGSEDDVLEGFRRGADDYVTKPFSIKQLLARIEALLRRAGKLPRELQPSFAFGTWAVDAETRTASSGEASIEVTETELAVLRLLADEAGRIVSRRTLLQEVWGFGQVEDVQTRTVDVHVAKLRKKLGDDGHELIETVRGEGYRHGGGGGS